MVPDISGLSAAAPVNPTRKTPVFPRAGAVSRSIKRRGLMLTSMTLVPPTK
jgi:hypothetical protein